jgi:uncharacterized protein (DUF1684 family)
MKKKLILLSIILSVGFIFIIGCKKKENPEIKNWKSELLKKRAAEDKDFKTSPTSPIAGLNRLTASPDKTSYIILKDGNFELSNQKTDDSLISVFQKDNRWFWEVFDKDFLCKSSDKPIESGNPLEGDITCKYKRYSFLVYPLDSRLVLVSFDPEKKELKEFSHRYYYPPNPDYRVKAKIIRLDKKEEVKMITSQNLVKTSYRYAKIEFEINGEKRHLFAYKKDLSKKPGEGDLFIPFKDKTNGKETYGAGRFIEIKEPVGDSFILDFNEAFNPLCNYARVWNCSYPPSENILDIPIKAGEKKYPIEH